MTIVNMWEPNDGYLWPPKWEHSHCCTYCGGLLDVPLVWWRSNRRVENSDVLLHPDCVPAFTSRLLGAIEQLLTPEI